MPSFQEMFMRTKGQPIIYQGKTLVMVDYFPLNSGQTLRFTFESCNGEWRQGACLRVLDGGSLVIKGEHLKHAVCWRDTAPPSFDVYLTGHVKSLAVYNVWDTGNGAIDAWHNGAAMIVEELPNGRRYHCNDGIADDDFDDIVFRIERVASTRCEALEASNSVPAGASQPVEEDLPPISQADLKDLFDCLDRPNPPACTNTFKETIAFLTRRNLPTEEMLEWLRRNGANCDCEVMFNTDAQWGEWAGRVPSDEE